MAIMIPAFTTQRLTLRAFSAEDADPLYHILGEEDVLRYFPRTEPPSCAHVQNMIAALLKHWEAYGYGLWAVESRVTQGLIGRCGLQYIAETEEVEIDYIVDKTFWGQGLATEAGQAALRYGFVELGLRRIVGIVHPENIASRRVLEKLGMRFTERSRYFGMDCLRYVLEHSD